MKEAFPNAKLLVRLFDRRNVLALKGIELAGAVREVFESAVCMGRMALEQMGVVEEELDRIEEDYRERDRRRLHAQHSDGDIRSSTALGLMYRPGRTPDSLDDEVKA